MQICIYLVIQALSEALLRTEKDTGVGFSTWLEFPIITVRLLSGLTSCF